MFAKALDVNGAAKVYILGRRLDKLDEVAAAAVLFCLPATYPASLTAEA
jgi:hypothetical protein